MHVINVYLPPEHPAWVSDGCGRVLGMQTLGCSYFRNCHGFQRTMACVVEGASEMLVLFKPMSKAINQGVEEQLEISHACSVLVCSATASLISLINLGGY